MTYPPTHRPIQQELLRLLLWVMVPLVLLIGAQGYLVYRESSRVAEAFVQRRAAAVASEVNEFLAATERGLALMAERPGVRLMDRLRCDPGLGDLIAIQPRYVNVIVVDMQGQVICGASLPAPGQPAVNLSDRDWFQAVLAGKPFALGQVRRGPILGHWVAGAAVPVRTADQAIIGAMVVGIDLVGWSQHALDRAHDPQVNSVLGVVDRAGPIVLRSPDAEVWLGRNLRNDPIMADFLRVGGGTFISKGVQGFDRFWAVQAIAGTTWIAYAGVRADAVHAAPLRTAAISLAVALGVVLAALWLAIRASRRLGTPMAQLARVAHRAGEGDLSVRAALAGPAEVVAVAHEFNRMLELRRSAEAELRANEQNLAVTLQSIGDAMIATDVAGLVTRMNPVAERLTGWLLADALGRPLTEVFCIVNSVTRRPAVNPVQQVMELGQVVGLANHTALLARGGQEYQIADSAAPIRDAANAIVGVVMVFSDVTEKYQTDASLRIAQRQLEIFFNHSPVAVAMFDHEMRYLFASRRWYLDHGIADRALRGVNHYEVVPGISEAWKAAHRRGLAGEIVSADEDRFERSDGTVQWLHWEVRPWQEPCGEIGGVLIFTEDITQRKAAEEALHESEILGRAILDSVSAEIAVLNSEGVIVAVNAPWQRFADENGMAPGHAAPGTGVGSNYLTVCVVDAGAAEDNSALSAREGIQAVLSGRQPSFTLEYPCHSPAAQRWFSMSATPLGKTGLGIGVVVSHTNITVRRLAEEALRAAKDHLQTTLNAIPDLLFEVDATGRVLGYHAHRSNLLAAPPDQFIGKTVADILPPAATDICMNALADAAANGWASGATYSLPLPQGETWFELSAAAMPQVVGVIPRFIVLARDVSDRIQNQQALQASLREKTALLLEVHHRVKNNLQVVASLLRLEAGRSAHAPTKAVLAEMQGRIRAMALLHESIYRAGTFAAIDLGAYVREVATQAFHSLRGSDAGVRLRLDLGSVQAGLDQATPCGLLLTELVSNALKHAFPAGAGGEFCITLQPVPGALADQWCLRVSDNGVGLPAGFAQRQHDSLGLQLAASLAEQMGGSLAVASAARADPAATAPDDRSADRPEAAPPGASFAVTFAITPPAPL